MKILSFAIAIALAFPAHAERILLKGPHLKSVCIDLEEATHFDFVDSISLLMHSPKRSWLVSVEPCEALDVAWGIGFERASFDKLCAGDRVIAYGENSVDLGRCTITQIVKVKNHQK